MVKVHIAKPMSLHQAWPFAFTPDAPFSYLDELQDGSTPYQLHIHAIPHSGFPAGVLMARNKIDFHLYMVEDSTSYTSPDGQALVLLHRFCRPEIRGFYLMADFDPLTPQQQAYYMANPFPRWRKS